MLIYVLFTEKLAIRCVGSTRSDKRNIESSGRIDVEKHDFLAEMSIQNPETETDKRRFVPTPKPRLGRHFVAHNWNCRCSNPDVVGYTQGETDESRFAPTPNTRLGATLLRYCCYLSVSLSLS